MSAIKVPVIPNFYRCEYVGVWYEMEKYDNEFQAKGGRCGKVIYKAGPDYTISVINMELRPDDSTNIAKGEVRLFN